MKRKDWQLRRVDAGKALEQIPRLLADLLNAPVEILDTHSMGSDAEPAPDMRVQVGGLRLVVEYKSLGDAVSVAAAIQQVQRFIGDHESKDIPLVVVPYMGSVGRQLCREAQIAWMDLSGNAFISSDSVMVRVEGRANQFKGAGRPANLFAPKSSRITHFLLLHPFDWFRQKDIVRVTEINGGLVSRVVRSLVRQNLLDQNEHGAVRPSEPDLLLDAWGESYSFSKHRILRGHIPSLSGEDLLRKLTSRLLHMDGEWAITGLSGAWLLTQFGGFRTVSLYCDVDATALRLEDLGFRRDSRGANVWLVEPGDYGPYIGASEQQGIQVASPVQIYLDLAEHPERSSEAAQEIRAQRMPWIINHAGA